MAGPWPTQCREKEQPNHDQPISANIMQRLQDISFKVNEFPGLLPQLKSYLLEKCGKFCAGQVSERFTNWKNYTSDREILTYISRGGTQYRMHYNPCTTLATSIEF